MVEELAIVGKGFPLRNAPGLVTGTLELATDIVLPGMLHARILKSPHAHARITEIDTSKAEALPGVEAVLTYKDVPPREITIEGANLKGRVLEETVRFVGDEVAAVAAVTEEIAEDALDLITVKYEVLPAVFDIEEAMKPGAPLVRPDGNVRPKFTTKWGDVEKGFAEADVVVEQTYRTGIQAHAPIGPCSTVACWEGDKLTAWIATQCVFDYRERLAQVLGIPVNKVRVIAPPFGGAFGNYYVLRHGFIAALLAKKANKPVKLEHTREEVFTTVKRRDMEIGVVKVGAKKDGSLTAYYHKTLFDNGGYGDKPNPYGGVVKYWRFPNGLYECYPVSINLVTAGCTRGVGDPPMTFMAEPTMDMLAEKLGLSPVEFRLKNHIRVGDPYPTPGLALSSEGYDEAISKGAEAIGWKAKWKGWGKPVEAVGPKRRGIGMAMSVHVSGVPAFGPQSAFVKIHKDGTVTLLAGVAEMGQGVHTTLAQIAAEELGVRFEDITMSYGDSETNPWVYCTYATMAAHMVGVAVKAAATDAKRQLLGLAAGKLKLAVEDLDIKDGRIYVKKEPEKGLKVSELTGAFLAPHILGRASAQLPFPSPVAENTMVHFAEVEVDTETGEVKVLKYVAAHDMGKAINTKVIENQIHGALGGIGYGLWEDVIFDKTTGRILNPNFLDYHIATVFEAKVEPIIVEPIDPIGAFGVKGIGESPWVPGAGAIANAVYNAIGVRITEIPITPDKILKALGKIR